MSRSILESGPASGPVLQAEGLAIGVAEPPGPPRIEGIDWSLRAGELWVVLGLHGAGKSDLLFTLAGLEQPAAGRLRWFGQNATETASDMSLKLRRQIGLVFESGGRLFHRLTVLENVALPLCYHENESWPKVGPRVERLLEALGLGVWAHVTPGQLRPAVRQRVALARALILQPAILLVDNPVAGLGAPDIRWWRQILGQLAAGGELSNGRALGVVVTSLELSPWLESEARFVLVSNRRWRVAGDRERLLASPDPEVREWLAVAALAR